ncbi:MAG: hypothetical protein JEZ00_12915 [Anaerolineaceae bacterium]|nr:hypothetical protein [Anaerolineaceae bacterium]
MDQRKIYLQDVKFAQLKKWVKNILPESLKEVIEKRKQIPPYVFVGKLFTENQYPWSSPNIWNELTSFYDVIKGPIIFEYGTGISSVWHYKNLQKKGSGDYIGVEFDENWFWGVVGALTKSAAIYSSDISIVTKRFLNSSNIDVTIKQGKCTVTLKLRPDASDYAQAINTECDIVIVDGAVRKMCLDYLLSTQFIRHNGLLMLMEAGRGHPDWWQGKLFGDDDYSEQVEKLIQLGGCFLDGNGLDSWSKCKRKSPKPTAYYYPMEAMKTIIK